MSRLVVVKLMFYVISFLSFCSFLSATFLEKFIAPEQMTLTKVLLPCAHYSAESAEAHTVGRLAHGQNKTRCCT